MLCLKTQSYLRGACQGYLWWISWSLHVFNNSNNNSKELCWHSLQNSPPTGTSPTLCEFTYPIRKAVWANGLFYFFSKKYAFYPALHRGLKPRMYLYSGHESLLWKVKIYSWYLKHVSERKPKCSGKVCNSPTGIDSSVQALSICRSLDES